jgi:hypothetical protein
MGVVGGLFYAAAVVSTAQVSAQADERVEPHRVGDERKTSRRKKASHRHCLWLAFYYVAFSYVASPN